MRSNNYKNALVSLLLFTSIFFVSESFISFPLIYPALIVALLSLSLSRFDFKSFFNIYCCWGLTLILTCYPFIIGSNDVFWTSQIWIAQMGVSLLLVFLATRFIVITKDLRILTVICFFILLFFFTASWNYGPGRFRLGFGPNMLYRFVIFFTIMLLFGLASFNSKYRKMAIGSTSIFLSFFIIWAIGSRGGILLFVLMLVFPLLWVQSKYQRALVSISIIFFAVLFIQNYEFLRTIFGRLILFDFANNSEAHRFSQYVLFAEYIRDISGIDFLFGSGLGAAPYDYIYPHSWLLEAFVYYGFLFTILLVFLFIRSWYSCVNLGSNFHRLWLLFSVPPFLSGSFFDNQYSIAFWIVLSLNYENLKRLQNAYSNFER